MRKKYTIPTERREEVFAHANTKISQANHVDKIHNKPTGIIK
jgi:hypothetical protein